jgi:hypothetical protein
MPREARRAVIAVEIPIPGQAGLSCTICRADFCPLDQCKKSMTHMNCCETPLCSECISKCAFQCRCDDDCEQVVAYCPYCRSVSAVSALDIFLGLSRKVCVACSHESSEADATSTEAQVS